MKIVALIVAGGKGKRMGENIPKQFLLLKKLPILMHTLKQFSHFNEIILVLPSKKIKYWQKLCLKYKFTQNYTLVEGGSNRFESVKNGLLKIDDDSIVAIHDGVRPLISSSLISKLISATTNKYGAIPIMPIKDSVREIKQKKGKALNRSYIYTVQTPQCFYSKHIKEAYRKKFNESFIDDSTVFESYGGKIKMIIGEETNLKITTNTDLKLAELLS